MLAAALGSASRSLPAARLLRAQDSLDDNLNVSTSGWKTDFSKHSVPLSEIRSGGPPRDGIPPIDDPRYVTLGEADDWLAAAEPVIAIALDQPDGSIAARAYPLQILVWHEIVNDTLGDMPVLATFCPLCYTAIAFDRRLEPAARSTTSAPPATCATAISSCGTGRPNRGGSNSAARPSSAN